VDYICKLMLLEFLINDVVPLNNTSAIITYNGTWGVSSNRGAGDYKDDISYTSTNSDNFSSTFSRRGIDYFNEKNVDDGEVDIYI